MTEVLKSVPPWVTALMAMVTSIVGGVYSAGYLAATVEAQARDIARQEQTIARLERDVRGLHARVRRLQNWPSRASEPTTQTDQQ